MKYMKNIYAINVFMVFLFYSIAYPTIKFVNLPLFANSTAIIAVDDNRIVGKKWQRHHKAK